MQHTLLCFRWLVGAVCIVCVSVRTTATADVPTSHFAKAVAPFLATHGETCHSRDHADDGIGFDSFEDSARVQKEYALFAASLG